MKVYELFENEGFDYPDEMEVIMDYLKKHGKLNVEPKTVEKLYRQFSGDIYCAGWFSVIDICGGVDKDALECFANWLSKVDI